ncbi:hypothetical protein JCM10213_001020 [Rhodosporidiobolus nylandii]
MAPPPSRSPVVLKHRQASLEASSDDHQDRQRQTAEAYDTVFRHLPHLFGPSPPRTAPPEDLVFPFAPADSPHSLTRARSSLSFTEHYSISPSHPAVEDNDWHPVSHPLQEREKHSPSSPSAYFPSPRPSVVSVPSTATSSLFDGSTVSGFPSPAGSRRNSAQWETDDQRLPSLASRRTVSTGEGWHEVAGDPEDQYSSDEEGGVADEREVQRRKGWFSGRAQRKK